MSYTTPPTKASGDTLSATDWNTYIKDNFTQLESRKDADFTTFTADVTVSSTTEASGTTIVTAGAVSCNGTDVYEIEFFSAYVSIAANASGNTLWLSLFEGSTQIGRLGVVANSANTQIGQPFLIKYRLTPSNGSHTYKITGHRSNANGTVSAGSGGTGAAVPGYIRVRKVT